MTDFYSLQSPTSWVEPPGRWSSSSLDEVGACPRRWQFLHSRWGAFDRFPVRQHAAAIEGQIIHEALDRLSRACGQRGNPALGTPAFTEAAAEADFFGGFSKALDGWLDRQAVHPRPGPPFRLRTSAQELANRAVRLFKEQYRPGAGHQRAPAAPAGPVELAALLRARGCLSEVRLVHPELPFQGVLDRVQQASDGVEIVDFKTGRERASHEEQLWRYAVLWWRNTGQVPARLRAQYIDATRGWPVNQEKLAAVEDSVGSRIADLVADLRGRPASARPGQGCRWCPVRARCADGWPLAEEAARGEGLGDAELTVASPPGVHGFDAQRRGGADVAVVHEAAIQAMLPALAEGQMIRILDGVSGEKGRELEIKAWTEVYLIEKHRSEER